MSSFRGKPLRQDDEGVSEVIGFILVFGITSMVMLGAMLGFNVAKENTLERGTELQSDTIAQSLANHLVDAALFLGQHHPGTGVEATHTLKLDLPHQLEAASYQIDLEPDAVNVTTSKSDHVASASLFRVGDDSALEICDIGPLAGGPLELIVTYPGSGLDIPSECTSTDPDIRLIYLQESS